MGTTLKALVDKVCEELEITVEEGGLSAKVKAAADAAGIQYETLKVTAEKLALEVLGVAPGAPPPPTAIVVTPPNAARKKAPEPEALLAVVKPEKRPREEDDDFELTKVQTEAERAAASKARAERDGAVLEVADDDVQPKAKRKKTAAPCVCSTLVSNYGKTSTCKAAEHGCICSTDPSKCRATVHPCSCKTLANNYGKTSHCKATDHSCICSTDPSKCRSTAVHPCTCKTLANNYSKTSYCKAADDDHDCLCAIDPAKCRQH